MTWLSKKTNKDRVPTVQSMFEQMMEDFWKPQSLFQTEGPFKGMSEGFPNVDLTESKGHLTVKAELPGVEEDEIKITLDHQNLVISGEKNLETDRDEDGHHYHECSYGSFRRVIRLPYEVDREKVEAKFKNGVLKIHMDQDQALKEKTRNISISS